MSLSAPFLSFFVPMSVASSFFASFFSSKGVERLGRAGFFHWFGSGIGAWVWSGGLWVMSPPRWPLRHSAADFFFAWRCHWNPIRLFRADVSESAPAGPFYLFLTESPAVSVSLWNDHFLVFSLDFEFCQWCLGILILWTLFSFFSVISLQLGRA